MADPVVNELGQSIGAEVAGWSPRPAPPDTPMTGCRVRVVRLDADRHTADLHAPNLADEPGTWTYLPYGPFADALDYAAWVRASAASRDPLFHAIVDLETGRATGVAALMRIDQGNGVIEVGHIKFGAALARSSKATEALFLLMRRAFDELGYRRLEWKCDALNVPSRRAADRFGFTFEGIFRQAAIVRGRNRDTAWYAIVDREWPALRGAFERWLDPANFAADGQQRTRLADLIADARRTAARR